jgi:hypothetical protein
VCPERHRRACTSSAEPQRSTPSAAAPLWTPIREARDVVRDTSGAQWVPGLRDETTTGLSAPPPNGGKPAAPFCPLALATSDHFRYRKWSLKPLRKQENRATARFLKPSAGLEPATPSLPWQSGSVARRRAGGQNACVATESVNRQVPAADSIVRDPPLPTRYPGGAKRSVRRLPSGAAITG